MTQPGLQTILNFHGLGTLHAGVDAGEARYWMDVDTFEWTLDRVAQGRAADPEISITFDDGNLSDLEIALPRLVARGLRAQFFVLVGRIGQPHYLDRDGIAALRDAGMDIGLHGRSHLDWRRLDDAGLEDETVAARTELAALVGAPVDAVAIPFGAYRRRVISRLVRKGFAAIYTSDGGRASTARRVRSRTSLTVELDAARLEDILADRLPLRNRVRRGLSAAMRRSLI